MRWLWSATLMGWTWTLCAMFSLPTEPWLSLSWRGVWVCVSTLSLQPPCPLLYTTVSSLIVVTTYVHLVTTYIHLVTTYVHLVTTYIHLVTTYVHLVTTYIHLVTTYVHLVTTYVHIWVFRYSYPFAPSAGMQLQRMTVLHRWHWTADTPRPI